MFATGAEAERAARMVRKVTGQSCGVVGDELNLYDVAIHAETLPGGRYRRLRDWEEVADFVENHAPEPEPIRWPGRNRSSVAGYLQVARDITASKTGNRDQAIEALACAIEEVLELV